MKCSNFDHLGHMERRSADNSLQQGVYTDHVIRYCIIEPKDAIDERNRMMRMNIFMFVEFTASSQFEYTGVILPLFLSLVEKKCGFVSI